ncbi:MAG: tRNA 4-thiouridine(8) synthase ThiI [Clostridia bacterium]|nr:tRNA 4-thiouridine(8) synthase ThiI [Clostridia bacterium]
MKQIILLKLGEIVLKGLNRRSFEKRLMKNVRHSLKHLGGFDMKFAQSTIYITPDMDMDIDRTVELLKKIFGVASVVRAYETQKDLECVKKLVTDIFANDLLKAKTFKCAAKRSDKQFPMKSPEICALIGEYILDNFPDLTVNVENPDIIINIEIRDYGAYVHTGKIQGAGGMPVGSNGKATLLLSGGIDSPVAGYMTAKRGVELNAVHFYSHPYTSERAKDKVIELAKIIAQYTGPFNLHIVHFTKPQLEIYEKCPDDELTVIMRRVMMKITEKIAIDTNSIALVTGESIGQVASQTLESLGVTDAATALPVIRPLIGMDKEEIVTVAHKIGTFNTSILPYEDCCTVFVPKHPKTKPKLEDILKSEQVLDMNNIIDECTNNLETIYIQP